MTIHRMISAASGVIEPPDLWSNRLPSKFADLCPRMVESEDGVIWTAAHRMADKPAYLGAFGDAHGRTRKVSPASAAWLATAEGRRWIQDRDEVAGEVLYSTGSVWDLINATENRDFIVACYRAYNDWLGELCSQDSERFIGVAKVPTTGAEDATAELVRAAEELRLKAVVLDAWPGGPDCPPAMKECDSFWEAAASLGAPISVYRPLDGGREPSLSIGAGFNPEFYSDLTTIIYSNITDRYPDIRFVSVAPTCGWAPQAYEQLSETYMRMSATRKIALGNDDLYPSDYLRRFFWYVTQEDRTGLLNRAYMGEAHLLWGSFAFMDHNTAWPNTRQLFERVTAGMPEPFRGKLAGENCARVYGVGNAGRFTPDEVKAYDSYALL
jgi:predicted TIM-barrel fold metal-dependent hydrolase